MKIIRIQENSEYIADDKLLADINEVGIKNIPGIKITGSKISFPSFTVGEIRLPKHSLFIDPINFALSLEVIFEMFAYIENSKNAKKLNHAEGFTQSKVGFTGFINDFLSSVKRLEEYGLSSEYLRRTEWQRRIHGRIDTASFSKQVLGVKGIKTSTTSYSRNSFSNQAIKRALLKVKELQGPTFDDNLLAPFRDVSSFRGSYNKQHELLSLREYSPNPFHSMTLAYALMIINDLSVGYSVSGNIKWHSFLVNSNQIFEKYVRSLLSRNIEQEVAKVLKPIIFAVNLNDDADNKEVEPDILINYYKENATAQMVLDVKNKKISVSSPLSKISTGDLYQISFYAETFKTTCAALVYPLEADMEPTRIAMRSQVNTKFFVIGINMKSPIGARHTKFAEEVKTILAASG